MNYRIGGRKFGVPSDQRRALLKGLVRALFTYEKIKTTDTRAKDVRSIAEKIITTAKIDTLHSRRQVRKFIQDETLIRHIFTQIAPEFKTISGGYTRIVRIGTRRGDNAPVVQLSLATEKAFGLPVLPEKIGTYQYR